MTLGQVDQVRRLAEAVGGRDALIRLVRQVLPKPRGRPAGSGRFRDMDAVIIAAARTASEQCGVPVAILLRGNVAMMGAAAGASPKAAVERLQLKARRPTKNAPAGF